MTIFIRLGRKQQKASDEGAPSTCENPRTPRTSPVAKMKPEQNHMKNHIFIIKISPEVVDFHFYTPYFQAQKVAAS